ncbi:hypothetical protein [Pseudogemmobacter bohemicus]|uniref:hypothetical protein n=1 Tax=Pseudogemmobacter bohemicus TaxID=2250708 RepID=UPI0013001E04|nr:hypothetical protein [Pseudogemmobacter bohemicus]
MAERLRAADGGYNAALSARIGDPPLPGFSQAPPIFQEEHWSEDLECFLSHFHFQHLREMPEFQRLPPASLIRALNRE